MPRPKFTSETAPRQGGKPGRITRANKLRTNAALIAAGANITPLDVLKGFAADPELNENLRITAASAAAPYLHARMPTRIEGADGKALIPALISITFTKADGS